MEYENLKKINASLKKMDIKGKKYVPVNERVKAFRRLTLEGGLEGDIVTEVIKDDDNVIVIRAEVFVKGIGKATGHAEEVRGSTNINRTSALENCETSAVGRALGMLGIGIDTSVATYEEVTNAQRKQEATKLATKSEKEGLMATIEKKAEKAGIERETLLDIVLEAAGFDRNKQPEGMTQEQYGKAMNYLNRMREGVI